MNNITESNISLIDATLVSRIKEIICAKPTYGYRRVTAILNAKYGLKPIRVHDGKVITLHSNTRWCSDGFVISCNNGDKVYVAFSMDTCD